MVSLIGSGPGGAVPGAAQALEPFPGNRGRHRPGRLTGPLGGTGARTALAVVAAAIALAALVNPTGPGHIALVDPLMFAGVLAAVLWALSSRKPFRLPYAVPMVALMGTGLGAAMISVDPGSGLQAVVQEVYLLLWCATVTTVARTPRALGVLLRVWAGSAMAWAAVLMLAVATGQKWLSGAGTVGNGTADLSGVSEGTRARLFFDHPNMAGNYFMVGVFIAIACGFPRPLWARVTACALLAGAVFLTGSNAAMLSLAVGAVVTVFLQVRVRRGLVPAAATLLALGVGLGVFWVEVVSPFLATASQSSNLLIRNSVGRGLRSAEARQSLFSSQLKIIERGDLFGIGPSVTKTTLSTEGAAAIHEAHNDYLGTLVERGPLGLLALLALIALVAVRAARFTSRPLPFRLAAVLPVPGALVGACVAFATTALTHEILHYRWLWTLFGLVAAVALLARDEAVIPAPLPDPRAP